MASKKNTHMQFFKAIIKELTLFILHLCGKRFKINVLSPFFDGHFYLKLKNVKQSSIFKMVKQETNSSDCAVILIRRSDFGIVLADLDKVTTRSGVLRNIIQSCDLVNVLLSAQSNRVVYSGHIHTSRYNHVPDEEETFNKKRYHIILTKPN